MRRRRDSGPVPHPAPVASRGRAGSRAAAWCARLAGDGGSRTRTPLESKPEQESLLLRGRRSRREPPDRRRVEEGAARRVSVTEGALPGAGLLTQKPLRWAWVLFPPRPGPVPRHRPFLHPLPTVLWALRLSSLSPPAVPYPQALAVCCLFFFSVSAVSWTLTHNPFRLWGLRGITHKPRREGLAEDDPPRLSETCRDPGPVL